MPASSGTRDSAQRDRQATAPAVAPRKEQPDSPPAVAPRTLLVTSALPYANGPIHIGHLVEYIQTDIWARFQRGRGHRCIYVCADDGHGTPIMLKAEQEGMTPEALIEKIGVEHRADFRDFLISFDNYHTTHSPENRACAELIYVRLKEAGHIVRKDVAQAYDPVKGMFLPDRFVKGTCPSCGAPDQYGDNCEVCGATYSPADLPDAVSVLSGEKPELRTSEHHFVRLADFEPVMRRWLAGGGADAGAPASGQAPVQSEIANKLDEWFDAGLQDWDISRDAPYFGFEIPDVPGKYFYVWLDAPIGYMGSFRHLCARREDLDFDAWWGVDSEAGLYQFVGKDIAYFHTLFWPAMLHGAGFRMPTSVFVHGFLTVNGHKMSKRTGTFIKARTYLDHLDPEYLRYYFACKLSSGIDDIDLSFDDFRRRVNADLVGKVVNIASRCAGFIGRHFGGRLSERLAEPALYREAAGASGRIAAHYEAREFGKAMREVMAIADRANRYIDERKPWVQLKDEATRPEVQDVCTVGLNLFRVIMTFLKPVLPRTAERVESFLRCGALAWDGIASPLLDHEIARFEPLLTRVEPARIEAMVADSMEPEEVKAPPSGAGGDAGGRAGEADAPLPGADDGPGGGRGGRIDVAELAKVDLRIAKVVGAKHVEGADRLLEIRVDLGDEERTVFAGIRAAYSPESLIGRHVVVVANLAPRKMRFGVSDGMILAAGPGGSDVRLLGVDEGAKAGMRVK